MKRIMALILLLMLLAACGPTGNVITTMTPTAVAPSLNGKQPSASNSTQQALAPGANPPTAGGVSPTGGTAAGIPNFDHIVLIVLENQGYSTALDSSKMPHLVDLAQKNV